jgi:FixJ family two-component response regulator
MRRGGLELSRTIQPMVVVVDDDSEIRESLQSLLSSSELGAVTFPSAESALESGLIAGASCLVTDVRMPGMPGTELQRRLRREHPSLPVIMITAHPDEEMKRYVLSNGVAFLFYKPFNPIDLLQAIHSVIPGWEKCV